VNKLVAILLLLFIVSSVKAQFTGGINVGVTDGLLSQSNCPDPTPNSTYYGGINDGFTDGLLSQSNCPDPTPNFTYYGGINDGFADGLLSQSNCPDPAPNFTYYGGINDGFADGLLSQSNCPDPAPNFTYYGGINDGFADGLLSQSNCPDPAPNFTYYGGINDGFADGLLSQSNCPDLTPNFTYFGGINDGVGWHCTQPIICTIFLSVELLFFNATPKEDVVYLFWATASEINNDFFTIEKSRDALNWEFLINIPGAGNSSSSIHYQTIHENPHYGISYYRLKQTDFDGQYKYSDIIAVDINKKGEKNLTIYPNPTSGIFYLLSNEDEYSIEVVNNLGKVILTAQNPKQIDLNNFSDGTYFIRAIFQYNIPLTKKLIIKK
jgi:hypothetical protein